MATQATISSSTSSMFVLNSWIDERFATRHYENFSLTFENKSRAFFLVNNRVFFYGFKNDLFKLYI